MQLPVASFEPQIQSRHSRNQAVRNIFVNQSKALTIKSLIKTKMECCYLCDTKEGVYNNPSIWSESSQSGIEYFLFTQVPNHLECCNLMSPLIAVGGEACLSNISIGEEGKT